MFHNQWQVGNSLSQKQLKAGSEGAVGFAEICTRSKAAFDFNFW
jgi:hypothetical protein